MTCSDPGRLDLGPVLERFPRDAVLIKRSLLKDETFRSICEDYALARATQAKFEKLPDAQRRPEVADYRVLAADLEKEIAEYLLSARKLLRP